MSTSEGASEGCVSSFHMGIFEAEWGTDKRKDLVFVARTAEAAERYDDMCNCMKALVKHCAERKEDLTVDERNLLSVAYKNVIGARRASWRTLNGESQDQDAKSADLIPTYKNQVQKELTNICNEVLALLKKDLIKKDTIDKYLNESAPPKSSEPEGEAQVFYLKMAGDYYRYLAEAVIEKKNEEQAADFYKQAFELSTKVLEPTHPIRLGLALNYSVCFYEILKDKKKACQLAKDAFDEAISKLDKLEEADYKDSTLIMQLLRDNLTLWTSSEAEQSQEAGDGDGD